jgi:hypothetical protein
MTAVFQPGGFESYALVRLRVAADTTRERINPKFLRATVSNAQPPSSNTGQVHHEISRPYPLLGTIRTGAPLVYATTAGKIDSLAACKALGNYAAVYVSLRQSSQDQETDGRVNCRILDQLPTLGPATRSRNHGPEVGRVRLGPAPPPRAQPGTPWARRDAGGHRTRFRIRPEGPHAIRS